MTQQKKSTAIVVVEHVEAGVAKAEPVEPSIVAIDKDTEGAFFIPLEEMKQWYEYTKDELIAQAKVRLAEEYDVQMIENKTGHLLWARRKDRDAKALAVGHIDTVVPHAQGRFKMETVESNVQGKNINIVHHPHHDDRLGIATMMEVLPLHNVKFDILITDFEETGSSTAKMFSPWWDTDEAPKDKPAYNHLVEFDRGGSDVVLYHFGVGDDEDTKKFKAAVGDCWGDKNIGRGSYTDIVSLPNLGCKGLNVGIGYKNPHAITGYTTLEHYAYGIQTYLEFYNKHGDTHFNHTYVKPVKTTTWNSKTSKKKLNWETFCESMGEIIDPTNNMWFGIDSDENCMVMPEEKAEYKDDRGKLWSGKAVRRYFGLMQMTIEVAKCHVCDVHMLGIMDEYPVCDECEEDYTSGSSKTMLPQHKPYCLTPKSDEEFSWSTVTLREALANNGKMGDYSCFFPMQVGKIKGWLAGDTCDCSGCGQKFDKTMFNACIVQSGGRYPLCINCFDIYLESKKNPESVNVVAGTCIGCMTRTTGDYLRVVSGNVKGFQVYDLTCVNCIEANKFNSDEEKKYVPRWSYVDGVATSLNKTKNDKEE